MKPLWSAWIATGIFMEAVSILDPEGVPLTKVLSGTIRTTRVRRAAWILFCGWLAGHILLEEGVSQ